MTGGGVDPTDCRIVQVIAPCINIVGGNRIMIRTMRWLTGIMAFSLSAASLQAGQVLRLDEVAVGELDPAKASDYADSILMFNLYDTLVLPRQGGPGHVPHLAESWTGSGTSYTFVLRRDATFQSGNPLTAEDVKFSFDRMMAFGQGLSFLFGNVDSVDVVDSHTVRFNLSEPYAPFVSALVRLPIVDKTLVMANLGEGEGEMGDWGAAYLSQNGAGTGAYSVQSHNPQEETVMVKNPRLFPRYQPEGSRDGASQIRP